MSPKEVMVDSPSTGESPQGAHQGYRLQWDSLVKTVDTSKGQQQGLVGNSLRKSSDVQKTILKSVSGYAAPGEVMACMGPSGSGKTSLLNVLSGRAAHQEGTLSVNGVLLQGTHNMKRWMARVAYVKQQDIFFDHLTVRDQLMYTSRLRMRPVSEVENVIHALRLQKVADSAIMAVSGGERKRVNIGTELLTNPSVLLLDEPTSGLDSTSAVALIRLLQTLAVEQGKTVITTIHQPSSALFRSFDRLLLLSEGSVVYFGTPVASLDYLEKQNLTCPPGYNAADHWMDLLVLQDEDEIATKKRLQLEEAWEPQQDAANFNETASADDLWEQSGRSGKYQSSWCVQYTTLTHRALKNSRSAIFTPLNLIKSIALGVVSGLLWFQREYSEENLNDIQSYYFFTMTFWVFDAMFTSLTAFPSEREVILKERASQSYRLSAYFMAKTTADAPVRLILPLLYMIVSFWMAGISSSVGIFLGTTGCTLLSVLSGEAIGLCLGAAVYDLQKGLTIMTVFTLFLMLLGGFFVENVPVFIEWGKFLSPFKYAFDSSLQLVFNKDLPCEDDGVLGDLCVGGMASADDVLDFIGVQGSVAFNVGMLLLLGFIPRYFAYLALRMQKDSER